MIRTSAPGKLIISGEYAVLDGAPCLVVAIDRRATCQLKSCDQWRFSSAGYSASASNFSKQVFETDKPSAEDAGLLTWHSYQVLGSSVEPAEICSDTQAFYSQNTKLGFGSSAAMSVAVSGALAQHSKQKLSFSTVLKAHQNFQGGKGSGADVAAAFYGGCLRYQAHQAQPHALPDNLHWMCIWTGSSADTQTHINRLDDWLAGGNIAPYEELKAASEQLTNTPEFLSAMKDYVLTLIEFDLAARLNIYTDAHQKLADLARDTDMVYKPSGAGGGDLGIVVGEDPEQIERFSQQVVELGLLPLPMPFTDQGLQIES